MGGWVPYSSARTIYLECGPHPATVTTRIIPFLVGNPYKPSFVTATGRGPHPIPFPATWHFGTWLFLYPRKKRVVSVSERSQTHMIEVYRTGQLHVESTGSQKRCFGKCWQMTAWRRTLIPCVKSGKNSCKNDNQQEEYKKKNIDRGRCEGWACYILHINPYLYIYINII